MLKFPDLTEVARFKWYHKPKLSEIHFFQNGYFKPGYFWITLESPPTKGYKSDELFDVVVGRYF